MSGLSDKSRYLALLLRHKPELCNLHMDKEGYVPVRELLSTFSIAELEKIVSNDAKGRYSFNEDKTKIRAMYGHSSCLDVNTDLRVVDCVSHLYHGTTQTALEGILSDGLIKPMSRKWVHLHEDKDVAKSVGLRHGRDVVVLEIDCPKLLKNRVVYNVCGTQVYLVKSVPVNCLLL